MTRRDPSSVIQVGESIMFGIQKGVGETKGFIEGKPSVKVFPWDYAEIWYAKAWMDIHGGRLAVRLQKGRRAAYDDRKCVYSGNPGT